ncbi:hypothetical protein PMAYCL1PPCAC_23884 [Pristionchus mayeri]|uniref:Uncharacterized protein n=1 Tax=Pristionchus mayeri TaxID=1317129 RepID=A0AAN5CZS6_9BILA|nr:hypothetical protein PMAYCL1PPCAC_23884 [Pristionchus mayeri]
MNNKLREKWALWTSWWSSTIVSHRKESDLHSTPARSRTLLLPTGLHAIRGGMRLLADGLLSPTRPLLPNPRILPCSLPPSVFSRFRPRLLSLPIAHLVHPPLDPLSPDPTASVPTALKHNGSEWPICRPRREECTTVSCPDAARCTTRAAISRPISGGIPGRNSL